MNVQSVYDTILKHQQQYYSNNKEEDYQNFLINPFAFNELTVKGVVDLSEMEFVQVSDNMADVLETKVEIGSPFKAKDFYKMILPTQLDLFPTLVEWIYGMLLPPKEVQNIRGCMCGLKLQSIGKPDKVMMMQFYPYQMESNSLPNFAVFSLLDVTHLVRGDVFWFRTVVYRKCCTEIHTFTFPSICFAVGELLSKREQEILTYLAKGNTSKEIAEKLYISTFTVNNHRKNMIARLGARDTTALIQLCQMSGILQPG